MGLTIYGQSGSRAIRALWLAEELGLDYTHDPVTFTKGTKEPGFEQINPNRRVPSIIDGDLHLWESMAINLHLAKKAGGDLAPKDLAEDSLATQWSFWVMTEVEKTLLQAMFHHTGFLGMEVNATLVEENLAALARPFAVLNAHLDGADFLLGDRFTVADLNVASVLSFADLLSDEVGEKFSDYPHIKRWYLACVARPALARARSMD